MSNPLPQTHRSCRGVPSTEGHISPTQREAKPCLIFPALGNGKNFFFLPFFPPFFPLTIALFQVFSPQPADPAPRDEHRGLLGLGQTLPGLSPSRPSRCAAGHGKASLLLHGIPSPCRGGRTPPQGRCPTTAMPGTPLSAAAPAPSLAACFPFPCGFAWLRASHAEAPGRGQRRDPPASPAEPSPSALPRFKANPDGKGVAGGPGEGGKAPSGANRRRRKSIPLIPPRWNPLLFYPPLFLLRTH